VSREEVNGEGLRIWPWLLRAGDGGLEAVSPWRGGDRASRLV
jgi:hypothetical protein